MPRHAPGTPRRSGPPHRQGRRGAAVMDNYELDQLRGTKVLDPEGAKIGRVEEIYLDDETREPEWLLVNTGLFGTSSSFVPLQGANTVDDGVRVPFPKDQVKDAPRIEPDR